MLLQRCADLLGVRKGLYADVPDWLPVRPSTPLLPVRSGRKRGSCKGKHNNYKPGLLGCNAAKEHKKMQDQTLNIAQQGLYISRACTSPTKAT